VRLTYTEFSFYSVLEDEDQVRLSCFHDGHEFYAILASEPKWHERRRQALDHLAMVIADGDEPGDYTVYVREQMREPLPCWECA
jgi:hypothetical protein